MLRRPDSRLGCGRTTLGLTYFRLFLYQVGLETGVPLHISKRRLISLLRWLWSIRTCWSSRVVCIQVSFRQRFLRCTCLPKVSVVGATKTVCSIAKHFIAGKTSSPRHRTGNFLNIGLYSYYFLIFSWGFKIEKALFVRHRLVQIKQIYFEFYLMFFCLGG